MHSAQKWTIQSETDKKRVTAIVGLFSLKEKRRIKMKLDFDILMLRFSTWQDIISAAAPLSADLAAATVKRLRLEAKSATTIRQAWGMTELSPLAVVCRKESAFGVDHFGHVGKVIPFTEAKIIDPESGEVVPLEEEGELCVRGPQVMKEYFKNKEATAATINSDGWLLTGERNWFTTCPLLVLGCFDSIMLVKTIIFQKTRSFLKTFFTYLKALNWRQYSVKHRKLFCFSVAKSESSSVIIYLNFTACGS